LPVFQDSELEIRKGLFWVDRVEHVGSLQEQSESCSGRGLLPISFSSSGNHFDLAPKSAENKRPDFHF
jgi:hypothetical protein